ncbi:oxidoreductase [Clostridium fermenticellae]|uniref:Oxidoreductase n=1 Tax=Clostridium fermenticellae TaxID=2068654 RepID=A0A386H4G9_9CLOT|nr:2-oxoacid:acceptor oxidoreductase family protein [Clostridium fermenticellae]AYD40385.1 oxidoreductase [Clostridium fermenticellae]
MVEIICAGFGGQGILTTGMMLINAGANIGQNVCWYPSYGSEMRGGTANCNVKISKGKIASPYCKEPDILFTMNSPAIDKFENILKQGGYLFVNSSIVDPDRKYRDNIKVVKIPTTELAAKVGNSKGSNIVMLGALIKATSIFKKEQFIEAMCKYFEDKGKSKYNPKNVEAFEAGYNAV